MPKVSGSPVLRTAEPCQHPTVRPLGILQPAPVTPIRRPRGGSREALTARHCPRTTAQGPWTTDLCAWTLALGPWTVVQGSGKVAGKVLTVDL